MKVSAKGAVIIVDDSAGTPRTISGDCFSYEIQQDAGAIDVTGFGEGSQNFVPGLPVLGISIDIFWNTLATTGARTVLQGILFSSTSKTVSITPEAGGQTFSGEFMLSGLNPAGAVADAIQLGTADFLVMGAVAPAWA